MKDVVHLRILDRWNLQVPDDTEGWFAKWVLATPNMASRHVYMGYETLVALRAMGLWPKSIAEYFGGLGCQTLVLDSMWGGVPHWVVDNNPVAAAHLQSLKTRARVLHTDAFHPDLNLSLMDLQVADFGDLTASKMAGNTPHARLLDRMFANKPSAVVLTDTAGSRLHFHMATYQLALSEGFHDYPSYLRAVHHYVERRWGYHPAYTRWQRWSAITAYLPEKTQRPVFREQGPATIPGIRILGTQ